MKISIVIPTYNVGELLRRTLQAIFAQDTGKSYEVIVVDSGSGPETRAIFKEFPIHLIEIPHEDFNHGLTRDWGAEKSRGEYLIFLNGDAEPGDRTWMDSMIQPMLENKAIAATQGGIRERLDGPRFFWDSCGDRFYFTSESKKWIQRYFHIGFSSINCAIRRSVWEKHPFGRVDICEDKVFQRRIHLKGDEIVYAQGWVYHTHDFNYKQLKRYCQNQGFGWRCVGERYAMRQAVRDTFLLKNYGELLRGIINRRAKKWSEIAYPFMRPYWVYKGNQINHGLLP